MLKNLLLELLTALLLFIANSALPIIAFGNSETSSKIDSQNQADQQKVRDFLAGIPKIRVVITNAPGNGHQSAGASVVASLRQLGYSGLIEVAFVFEVRKKLGFLLPPFDPDGSGIQEYPKQKLRFVQVEYSKGELRQLPVPKFQLDEVPLAIIGANDWDVSFQSVKTKALLNLQPIGRAAGNWMSIGQQKIELRNFEKLGYVFDIPNPSDPAEFISAEMSHFPELLKKVPGLQIIVNNMPNHQLASAYGFGFNGTKKLAVYIAGIHLAAAKEPDHFRGGTVISLFSNINDKEKLEVEEELHKLGIRDNVKIVDIDDPESIEREYSNLKSNEILLVRTGPVSKAIFEYFYSKSTVVSTIAGKNGENLMRLIGKPYLNTVGSFPYHIDEVDEPVSKWKIMQVFNLFGGLNKLNDELTVVLADYILKSKMLESPVNKLFYDLRISSDSVSYNKLARGLLNIIPLIQSQSDLVKPEIKGVLEKLEPNKIDSDQSVSKNSQKCLDTIEK